MTFAARRRGENSVGTLRGVKPALLESAVGSAASALALAASTSVTVVLRKVNAAPVLAAAARCGARKAAAAWTPGAR